MYQEHILIPCDYVLCKVGYSVLYVSYCSSWLYSFQSLFKMNILKVTNTYMRGCSLYMQDKCLRKDQLGSNVGGRHLIVSVFLCLWLHSYFYCIVKSDLKSNHKFMCHKKTINMSVSLPLNFNKKYNFFWLHLLCNRIW